MSAAGGALQGVAAARTWIIRGGLLWGALAFGVAAARPPDGARGVISWLLALPLVLGAALAGVMAFSSRPARWATGAAAQARARLLAWWFPAGIVIYLAGFLAAPEPEHWNKIFGRLFWPLTVAVIAMGVEALAASARRGDLWLLLGSIVLAFLIGEVAVRILLHSSRVLSDSQRSMLDPAQVSFVAPKFAPHHYAAYIPRPGFVSRDGRNRHNSLGFRGDEISVPKPANRFRVAALGGSCTYDTGVSDWKEAYPEALEQELAARPGLSQVEVINAGVPGYGMAEILINLEFRVLDLQPDLIVVYENTNDVAARIVPPALYRGDNGGRRRIWDSDTVSQVTSPIMRLPSALLRLLSVRLRWLGGGSSVSLDSVVDVPCTGHHAEASCLGMTVPEALQANPPIYFERHLRGVVALARAAGVKTLLLSWAHNPDMDDYASRPEMEAAFAQQNEIIARIAREEGTGFLDLAALMPKDKNLWADGRHMTAEGNKVRARLIADYLVGSGLLQSSRLPSSAGPQGRP